jgi:opacity protein-like surface antigen
MGGARLRFLPIVAALSCVGTSAFAADYPQPQCYDYSIIAAGRAPPGAVPCYVPPPPVVIEEFSGWYLRGDIGFSNQYVKNLENVFYNGANFEVIGYGFDAAPFFGLGVGYYFNDWLRFDVTGEYRGRANFHGLEIFHPSGCCAYTDEYHASKSEWLFLANAYVDLGTWWSITPFVGAGVGASRNTIYNFTDNNIPNLGVAFGADASKWNFAWALHAGLAYKVSKNFTVELAYRYVDLGDAITGDLITYTGVNNIFNPMGFHRLTSHDVKLGVRFNLDGLFERSRPVYYAPPPQTYSPPVYSPPVYSPPPLRSRG